MSIEIRKPQKITIKEEGVLISSDIDILDFDSSFTLVDQGDGSVTIEGGASSSGAIEVQDENVTINSNTTKINFGRGMIVTNNATDKVTVDSNGVYYRVAGTEAELIAAMNELNSLGGGAVQFITQIGLTQDRTFNFNNIRWIGNTSNETALKLNGYKITVEVTQAQEGGAYFQNFRFLGENNNATGFNQQILNTSSTKPPLFMWFDNCFFKNIISRSDTTYVDESQATTNGVVLDLRNGATTVIFENVDFHNNGIPDPSTTVRHAPLTIWAAQGKVTRINVLGQYSQYTARNRYRLMPPSGSASSSTYIEFATDGTAVHYGNLPVISLGKLNQSLIQNPESKQIFYISSGSTLTFEPNDNPIGESLAVINSTAGNTSFTLPSVFTSGSGFYLTFFNKGNNSCTINANAGQNINGLSQYIFSGNEKLLKLYYENSTSSWYSWKQEVITVSDTSSLDLTRTNDNISGVVLPAGINHDALQNFVANKHIDHSTVSILAGTGLTGGGNITANRTISMPNVGVTGTYGEASSVSVITTDAQGRVAVATSVPIVISSTQVTDFVEATQDAVGSILTDTTSVDFTYNDTLNQISGVVLPAGVNHDALQNFVANKHIDHSTVSILAGTGLTGGGNITANRTLTLASSGVTPGTYGNSTNTPVVTVDTYGRVTAINTTPTTGGVGLQLIAYNQSLGLSTTTSTSWQTKISFNNTSLVAGTYRIGWSYAWYYRGKNNNFQGRVTVDGNEIMIHRQEPKDTNAAQRHRACGFIYVDLSSGIHSIELDWRSSQNGTEAGILETTVEIMKG